MKLPVSCSELPVVAAACEEVFSNSGFIALEYRTGTWRGVREEASGESTLMLQLCLERNGHGGQLAVHATRLNHRTALLEGDLQIEQLFANVLESRLSLI